MPKKPTKQAEPDVVQVNLRIPPELLAQLDAWQETLNSKGHARWTRNGIILAACERAIAERASKGEAP